MQTGLVGLRRFHDRPVHREQSASITEFVTKFWHARRRDIIAFERILDEVRVDSRPSAHRDWNGLEFPAPPPAGGGRDDLRTRTAASKCPPFRRDPSALTSIEGKVRSDGIGEPHITQTFAGLPLVLIPDVTASDTPTSNAARSRSLQRSYPGTTDTAGSYPKIQAAQHGPNPSCAPPASPQTTSPSPHKVSRPRLERGTRALKVRCSTN